MFNHSNYDDNSTSGTNGNGGVPGSNEVRWSARIAKPRNHDRPLPPTSAAAATFGRPFDPSQQQQLHLQQQQKRQKLPPTQEQHIATSNNTDNNSSKKKKKKNKKKKKEKKQKMITMGSRQHDDDKPKGGEDFNIGDAKVPSSTSKLRRASSTATDAVNDDVVMADATGIGASANLPTTSNATSPAVRTATAITTTEQSKEGQDTTFALPPVPAAASSDEANHKDGVVVPSTFPIPHSVYSSKLQSDVLVLFENSIRIRYGIRRLSDLLPQHGENSDTIYKVAFDEDVSITTYEGRIKLHGWLVRQMYYQNDTFGLLLLQNLFGIVSKVLITFEEPLNRPATFKKEIIVSLSTILRLATHLHIDTYSHPESRNDLESTLGMCKLIMDIYRKGLNMADDIEMDAIVPADNNDTSSSSSTTTSNDVLSLLPTVFHTLDQHPIPFHKLWDCVRGYYFDRRIPDLDFKDLPHCDHWKFLLNVILFHDYISWKIYKSESGDDLGRLAWLYRRMVLELRKKKIVHLGSMAMDAQGIATVDIVAHFRTYYVLSEHDSSECYEVYKLQCPLQLVPLRETYKTRYYFHDDDIEVLNQLLSSIFELGSGGDPSFIFAKDAHGSDFLLVHRDRFVDGYYDGDGTLFTRDGSLTLVSSRGRRVRSRVIH